jgi:hypothetical protein
MTDTRRSLRFTVRRALLGLAVAPLALGCTARTLVAPVPAPTQSTTMQFAQSQQKQLDLLFMIDNSSSMQPLQAKLAKNLPTLLDSLTNLPNGSADMHIAVVSSSMGYDSLANLGGCKATDVQDGYFQNTIDPTGTLGTACAGVTLNGDYINNEPGNTNYTGNLGTLFGCIALLGQSGCGFEAQMASVQAALDPNGVNAGDGFLRDDAVLAVVMLTNEDDCSAPQDTDLFDNPTATPDDPEGRLMSYRCTEFGILCNGQPPPHTLAAMTTVALDGCMSAEGAGKLTPVATFENALLALKGNDPTKVLFAAITAAPTPFKVSSYQSLSSPFNSATPTAPGLVPSCMNQGTGDYGDPAVRITMMANDLKGTTYDICQDDFGPAMTQIAKDITVRLGPSCINGTIANRPDGTPDCSVSDATRNSDGTVTESPQIPYCNPDAAPYPAPCWRLYPNATDCPTGQEFQICRESTCDPTHYPVGNVQAKVSCAIQL